MAGYNNQNHTSFLTPSGRFDHNNPAHRKAIQYAVACYLAIPYLYTGNARLFNAPQAVCDIQNFTTLNTKRKDDEYGVQIVPHFNREALVQNISTQADYPEFLTNLFKTIDNIPSYDNAWMPFFDIRPLNASDGYDVERETASIVFDEIPPQHSIQYYGSSATKYRIFCKWYGAGLGIDFRLIQSRDFFSVEKQMMQLRQAAYVKKAEVIYALIEAMAAGIDIAWHDPSPVGLAATDSKYVMSRDAETINAAAVQLINNNKDYPGILTGGAETTFKILCPHNLTLRVRNALNYRIQDIAGAPTQVPYNFEIHPTMKLLDTTKYYVGIGGGENTMGSLLDFRTWMDFDISKLNQLVAAWESWAANIGRVLQWTRCATA